MTTHQSSHPLIPAEIDAEMTPAVRAFAHALIHSFQLQIAALQAGIVELNSRIVELESQVNKLTPQNSSVPPSTVHRHGKPNRKPLPGKKRKQGGQQGHKRTIRELIPSDQCDDVIERKPDACRKCGGWGHWGHGAGVMGPSIFACRPGFVLLWMAPLLPSKCMPQRDLANGR